MPVWLRLVLLGGGVLLVAAGIALLTTGSFRNAARLGRLAGILILLGLVAVVIGVIGRD
ncbi:MAG: hypothetical protein ACRDFS_10220 [Chloroflexota bacterium]